MEIQEAWSDFNVAMIGATAALAGLLIVAASVNIAEIIKMPVVAARLAAGLAGLLLAIIGSAIGLVPDVSASVYGALVIPAAVAAALYQIQATRQIFANRHPANELKVVKSAIGFIAPACYLVGGVLLVAGSLQGAWWFAGGAIAGIIAAIFISWIALVEILR